MKSWVLNLDSSFVYSMKSTVDRLLFRILFKIILNNSFHEDLKKRGDLRNSLVLLGVTPLWHVAQWVARAPPHHSVPAFLNPHGR